MNVVPGDTDEREARLNEAIAWYLAEVAAERPPARTTFLAGHPDLADDLGEFLDNRAEFQGLIRRLAEPTGDLPRSCPYCRGALDTARGTTTCGSCGREIPAGPAVDPFPVPHRVGRFELRAVLGRGAFGTVYEGWDPEMRRPVAVKALRPAVPPDPDRIERFLREPAIAAQVDHPGIVRVYDVGRAGDVPYLVSEFVAGPTLAGRIQVNRPNEEEAAAWVVAVADALHAAHEAGIVHRDVKPSNILLRGDQPLLTDFGLAHWDGEAAALTATGEILGTLAYMSPEQVRGGAVDRGTDIYSLGAVLYELLTGERLFVGAARQVLRQIEHTDPPPPRSLDGRVSRPLENICLMCLRKERDWRYQTAADLAADLRRFLDKKPVRARPIGPAGRLILWGRRNRSLAAAGSVAAVLLLATSAVSTGWAIHAGRQADRLRSAVHEKQRTTAEGRLDLGLREAEQGDPGAALLWLAAGAAEVPPGADDLDWALRANFGAWRARTPALTDCAPAPPDTLLVLSPDGAGGWTVDPDGQTVRRWDVTAGRVTDPALKHPGRVTAISVSPDGGRVATQCSGPGPSVRLWAATDGKLLRSLDVGPGVYALALGAADGRTLVTVARETKAGSAFQAWDTDAGTPRAAAFRHPGWVSAMAVAADNQTLFAVTDGGRAIRRWELPVGRAVEGVHKHPVPIRSLAVSRDGRHLLTGGADRAARLYETGADRVAAVLRHRAVVTAVAFGPDGRGLVTAGPGDAVRSWEGVERLEPAPAALHPRAIRAAAVSPDGRRVVTGADDYVVRMWEVADRRLRLVAALAPQPSPIAAVAFSPDGARLAVSTYQHPGADVYDVASGTVQYHLRHPETVHHIAFDPTGHRVVTAGHDPTARVWDAATGAAIGGPLGHGRIVSAVGFRLDGGAILTASLDGSARVWDAATGAPRGPALWHGAGVEVRAAAFAPDGRVVLTAGEDGMARQWDPDTGQSVRTDLAHGEPIWAVAYDPTGRFVLTAGSDQTARVWEADTGRRCGPPLRHAGTVRVVAFGPGGRWAVTASDDGTARAWAVGTGRAVGPAVRHDGGVRCAVIEPGGAWVVTAGLDQSARAWPGPAAADGPAARLALWAQVVTGAELDAAGGVQVLGPADWRDRRSRLRDAAGVLVP